ncbi:PfkB family carbohydrate kinase [Synoicihabitans lomoniglobus]|uniref:PfkB family carbohydrate kinase n=1 Tax=Synoicihabitans lomoniglobus TaxID=2909285 RepID=A0AAE9ZY79_9BACT|nr:PfkB family carbohydrate kinase [Opitutaceae bacterium LMO-M01]WED65544.1 PfkB family carbohydrate kinase [Opitutaceae bacterium LMO-M01]
MPERPTILCFGEILWDFLPAGLFAGGAPFNVGYHLHQLNTDVRLISGLGRDTLGGELLRRLKHWNLDTSLIETHQGLPTGTVIAALGERGDASYDITTSVAWDQITVGEDATRAAVEARAIVFGSLAQRTPFNQSALARLFTVLPDHAWRVFDVNLRAPHDDLDLVRKLAAGVDLLKLNASEAARLALGTCDEQPGAEEAMARAIAADRQCPMICITAAERGAGLLINGHWHWEPGREVEVADTVGAGDAFLARLLSHLLAGEKSPAESLASACRHGEWVASQRGATPAY